MLGIIAEISSLTGFFGSKFLENGLEKKPVNMISPGAISNITKIEANAKFNFKLELSHIPRLLIQYSQQLRLI